jgi:glycosyltransferase involved in cell wall biosynthesis
MTQVLLTAYNGSAHLPALLDSLLAQTDPDFTVLMQDDGSGDTTPGLLREAADRDRRFTFGAEQGKHLGAAGNFLSLIRQSEADYCLLCDQDDIWEPEKIAVLKQAMQDLEAQYGPDTPLLVHSDCSLISQNGEKTGDSFFRHQGWDPGALTLPRLLVQNNVTGCTLIMNRPLRNLIAAHARAKDLFMHDWFIALTAASFGRIAFVDRPLTRYRQHGNNTIGASAKPLLLRGLDALRNRGEAKRRILLTYTHTKVFRKMYENGLPAEVLAVVDGYLATQRMRKVPRVLAVRRMGCVMQSPVTRLGQVLFG